MSKKGAWDEMQGRTMKLTRKASCRTTSVSCWSCHARSPCHGRPRPRSTTCHAHVCMREVLLTNEHPYPSRVAPAELCVNVCVSPCQCRDRHHVTLLTCPTSLSMLCYHPRSRECAQCLHATEGLLCDRQLSTELVFHGQNFTYYKLHT